MLKQTEETDACVSSVDDARADIDAWMAAWPAVRRQVQAIINEYARWHPAYDRNYADWIVDEIDSVLRNLEHRVTWLEERM